MNTEDKLVVLIEEAAEVIKAATKCLRFGFKHEEPNYGRNDEVLACEVGDFLGVLDSISLDSNIINSYRKHKMIKVEKLFESSNRHRG